MNRRFKLDENLPTEIADELRGLGQDVQTVADELLTGAPDPTLLARIQTEGRVFLTMDKGIADIRRYPPDQYPGLILFRPSSMGRRAVAAFVRRSLQLALSRDPAGHLIVVSESGIRIR